MTHTNTFLHALSCTTATCFTYKNGHTSVDPYYFSNVFLEKTSTTPKRKSKVSCYWWTQRLLCVFCKYFYKMLLQPFMRLFFITWKWSEFRMKCSEIWCVNVNNQVMHNICHRSVLKIKYLHASTMAFLLLTARQLSKPILYCEYALTLLKKKKKMCSFPRFGLHLA